MMLHIFGDPGIVIIPSTETLKYFIFEYFEPLGRYQQGRARVLRIEPAQRQCRAWRVELHWEPMHSVGRSLMEATVSFSVHPTEPGSYTRPSIGPQQPHCNDWHVTCMSIRNVTWLSLVMLMLLPPLREPRLSVLRQRCVHVLVLPDLKTQSSNSKY